MFVRFTLPKYFLSFTVVNQHSHTRFTFFLHPSPVSSLYILLPGSHKVEKLKILESIQQLLIIFVRST